MPNIIQFRAKCRPSTMMRRMLSHRGDVSDGSSDRLIATRTILGKRVKFYANGRHVIAGSELTEEEQFSSEVLRLAHASLLVNDAVGDEKACYVDARSDPVIVKFWGHDACDFIARAAKAIHTGIVPVDYVFDTDLRSLRHV